MAISLLNSDVQKEFKFRNLKFYKIFNKYALSAINNNWIFKIKNNKNILIIFLPKILLLITIITFKSIIIKNNFYLKNNKWLGIIINQMRKLFFIKIIIK